MIYLVLTRFFASFTLVAVCDNKDTAKNILEKIGGDSYIHKMRDLTNDSNYTHIYIKSSGPELIDVNFDKKMLRDVSKEEEKQMRPLKITTEHIPLNIIYDDSYVKMYNGVCDDLNIQPQTFATDVDGELVQVDAPLANI